jgi:hypothetical protein
MDKYVILVGWWLGTLYFLANGIFAIRSPTGWLRARWAAKRSLGSDTPATGVRLLGLVFIVLGAVMATLSYQFLLRVLRE